MFRRIALAHFAPLALCALAACSGADLFQPGLDPSGRHDAKRFDPTRGAKDVPGKPGPDTSSTSPDTTTAPEPTTAGSYGLSSAGGAGCFQTAGGATTSGTTTTVGPCATGGVSQTWTLPAVGENGPVTLKGLCLNAFGGFGNSGDKVGLWGCEGAANEKWTFTAAGELKGMNALCVGPKGGVAVAGATYELQPCTGGAAQKWTHVTLSALAPTPTNTAPVDTAPSTTTPTAPSEPTIASTASAGLVAFTSATNAGCLATAGGATTSGTLTTLAACSTGAWSQTFLPSAVGATGAVSIQGLCLNAFGGNGNPGDRVGLYLCSAEANSQWTVTAAGELRGIHNLCVGPVGGSVVAGVGLELQSCTGASSQKWTMRTVSLNLPATTRLVATAPTLPAELTLPTDAVVTGRQWRVPAGISGPDLQVILASANPGDEILLPAGQTVPNMWLPPRKGAGWITVRTDIPLTQLPPAGTRMDSATARRLNLARIIGGRANDPVIFADNGTGGWRFVAVEVTQDPQYLALNTLIALGWGNTASAAAAPADFVFDRIYAHNAEPAGDLTRCFLLNSVRTAIVNSSMTCHGGSSDAMAIGGWGGPGPFRIENNSIAGSGHGLIFGGNDPLSPEIMPADVVLRGNRIWTPLTWRGVWPKKTLLEFKIGHRILVEGNVFEQTWDDAQNGVAILLKSTNQSGTAPFSQTSDVTIRRNWIRDVAGAFNLAARPETLGGLKPADPLSRVLITDNVVENVCAPAGTKPNGNLMQLTGDLRDVQIVNNTLLHDGTGIGCGGRATFELGVDGAERLIIERNVMTAGTMGWNSSVGQGIKAFSTATSWQARDNVIVGLNPFEVWRYPVGSTLVPTLAGLSLTSQFALPAGSPYAGAGADANAVWTATARARTGPSFSRAPLRLR